MSKTGYLLINLGTPNSPAVTDVRQYLDEFLMDPYVIDLPWIARRLLLSLFILPFRPKKSAHAYAQIWTPEGSPLLTNSFELVTQLREHLEGPVELAMRYGNPTIASGLKSLKEQGADQIVVAPLYPQFADSTVSTSVEAVNAVAGETPIKVLPPFYDEPAFIDPLANLTSEFLDAESEHLLLSFHGLPEQHITRADPTESHCLQAENCCEVASKSHATCYRHQVFATAHALGKKLGLTEDQYTVSFQSRLGRLPWLRPYTDQLLAELPTRGIKRLVVACPAFVADNLETLEEIGIQGRETFMAAGGESFTLVPCLNTSPEWVSGLKQLLENQTVAASSLT